MSGPFSHSIDDHRLRDRPISLRLRLYGRRVFRPIQMLSPRFLIGSYPIQNVYIQLFRTPSFPIKSLLVQTLNISKTSLLLLVSHYRLS